LVNPSTTPVDWGTLKEMLRPQGVASDAWEAVWANFRPGMGNTLADLYLALSKDASYLAGIHAYTNSISRLLSFEIQKANDTAPLGTLTSSSDASFPTPSLELSFGRTYLQPLTGRYRLGALGRGWSYTGDMAATADEKGNVTIYQTGSYRSFLKKADGTYQGGAGERGTLSLANGTYQLREAGGTIHAFRTD